MSRAITSCAAILFLAATATLASAGDGQVTITVERPKPPESPTQSPPFTGQRPSVDVAILLDTSNSMDGLISQAKSQLWTIVQQFAKAKKDGQTPVLRVALFEYGNSNLPASEGYIRQIVPLTDDLDLLSEALFALRTCGGDEYCGQVIDEAITLLDWSKEHGGYKAIFIAGNEPFTQGPVDYHKACKRAIEQGVVVNTIHCGASAAGISGNWRDGAQLAEGQFFNIDQDRAVAQIKCPQDEIIIKLNAELNKTYLWFGCQEDRDRYAANQVAQDANAGASGPASEASRAVAKASSLYCNTRRDLVDTMKEDKEILVKLKSEELPDSLRQLAPSQRAAYVKQVAQRRVEVQAQINQLAAERESYLAQERTRLAGSTAAAPTLGDAVITTVQQQLSNSGFETAPAAR